MTVDPYVMEQLREKVDTQIDTEEINQMSTNIFIQKSFIQNLYKIYTKCFTHKSAT